MTRISFEFQVSGDMRVGEGDLGLTYEKELGMVQSRVNEGATVTDLYVRCEVRGRPLRTATAGLQRREPGWRSSLQKSIFIRSAKSQNYTPMRSQTDVIETLHDRILTI